MRLTVTFVQLVNLFAVGALPLVFFKRDGRLNLLWWLTALPFFVAGVLLLLASAGWLLPVVPILTPLGQGLALTGLASSISNGNRFQGLRDSRSCIANGNAADTLHSAAGVASNGNAVRGLSSGCTVNTNCDRSRTLRGYTTATANCNGFNSL